MGKRKINESDYAYIVQLYQDGSDVTSIANMFGVTTVRIRQILRENSVDIINRRYFNFSDSDKDKIVDMYKNGESTPAIAKKYNCSNRPIYKVLHERGIKVDTPLRKVPKEDHEKVVEMYNSGMSQKEISEVYGCSESVIWIIMKNLNAPLRPNGYTHDEVEKMYELYKETKSCTEVANILNMDKHTVRDVLNKHGFKTERIKYHCDDYYFDNVDTDDKAYIIGLLWSDGCNNLKNGSIHLQLQERDRHILESINERTHNERRLTFTNLSTKNPNNQDTYTLTLKSDHMAQVLNDYGMVPRKSLVLKFPDWLDESLYHSFMRGYVDGDGSIYFSTKKKACRVSMVGTKAFLDKVQSICKDIDVKTSISHRKTHNEATYMLTTTSNSGTITFLQWMYCDADLKLERKFNKYQQILDYFNINNSLAEVTQCQSNTQDESCA